MSAAPIRFLHISDLHLRGGDGRRFDQDKVLAGLLRRAERWRDEAPLDLIFVTGDLANHGLPEEYSLVEDFLGALLEVARLPRDRLFVVPGNHDVNRATARWLLRTLPSAEEAADFFLDPTARRFHVEKFAGYAQSMHSFFGPGRALGLHCGGDAVEYVEVRGARIAVASFNSAWFAQADDDHGNLWLGEASVARAAERIRAGSEVDLAIALFHHPLEFLSETERDEVEPLFERGFDLVLRGHLHKSRAFGLQSARGRYFEVAAPATYQGSRYENGCFVGELDPVARTLRFIPYVFGHGGDPWVVDHRVFPDSRSDGAHVFVLEKARRGQASLADALAEVALHSLESSTDVELRHLCADLHLPPSLAVAGASAVARAIQRRGRISELWSWLSEGLSRLRPFTKGIVDCLREHARPPLVIPPLQSPDGIEVLYAFRDLWTSLGPRLLADLGDSDLTREIGFVLLLRAAVDGQAGTAFGARFKPDKPTLGVHTSAWLAALPGQSSDDGAASGHCLFRAWHWSAGSQRAMASAAAQVLAEDLEELDGQVLSGAALLVFDQRPPDASGSVPQPDLEIPGLPAAVPVLIV